MDGERDATLEHLQPSRGETRHTRQSGFVVRDDSDYDGHEDGTGKGLKPPMMPAPRDTRIVGAMLVLGSTLQLAAAAMVKLDVFVSPVPLVKLRSIRRSGRGWVLQAVLFPLAFAVVTTGFGMLARCLGGLARGWATTVTALSALLPLLWLPITRGRLTVGREVDQMIWQHQPGMRVDISGGGGWAFWPYTGAALTSVGTVSAALTVSRLAQKTGIGVLLACTLTRRS